MLARGLAIASLLAQGCAPAALVGSDGRARVEMCDVRTSCAEGGGSGTITIPLLIVLGAMTVPIVIHRSWRR